MNSDEKLPLELVWGDKGSAEENHLSEIVRTAIADGQMSIVPEVALSHLQSCEPCTCAIGDAAMLSARVGTHWNEIANEIANELAPEIATATSKEAAVVAAGAVQEIRLPWLAIAAALLVAGLAALPSVVGAQTWFDQSYRVFARSIPHLIHGAVKALQGGGAGASLAVSYASALLLLVVGVTVGMRQKSGREAYETGAPR